MAKDILESYRTEREAAAALRQSLRTLRGWRSKGTGPSWNRVGRSIFYSDDALREFVENSRHDPVRARKASVNDQRHCG